MNVPSGLLIAILMFAALATFSCDEDDGSCTQAKADRCLALYDQCLDGLNDLDASVETHIAEEAACRTSYCDCLDAAGCEIVGDFDCGG